MINIPSNEKPYLTQSNRAERLGDIVESFNLDLRSNLTGIRTTRSKVSISENTFENFQFVPNGVYGISSFNSSIYIFSGTPAQYILKGGNSAWDSFAQVSSGFNHGSNYCDITQFQNKLYATSNTVLYESSDGDTWSAVSGANSLSSHPHLLAVLGNRLYVTNNNDQVDTVNSAGTYSTTGTGTLDLELDGYTISFIITGNDRVWIGASPSGNNATNQVSWIYEWDGESENSPSQKYRIDSPAILSATMLDDRPMVLDIRGRLLAFNGVSFKEVARLPLHRGELLWGLGTATNNNRAVHPKGMTTVEDEVLINVANRLESSTTDPLFADFPGGVWAYNTDNGLYHKYSPSYVLTSSTSPTDYGQYRIEKAGVIYSYEVNNRETTEGGSVLWSAQIFQEELSTNEDGIWALFVDDTLQTTPKVGWFITKEIHSTRIDESWNEVYAKYKKLLNSADKIVVKYRIDKTFTNATCELTNTNRLQTNEDVSTYGIGDEVMIIQGVGSGKSAHIKEITAHGGGYTIDLDEDVSSATGGVVAQFSHFQKAGTVDYEDTSQIKQLTADTQNHFIQYKVELRWTGNNEMDGLTIKNNRHRT